MFDEQVSTYFWSCSVPQDTPAENQLESTHIDSFWLHTVRYLNQCSRRTWLWLTFDNYHVMFLCVTAKSFFHKLLICSSVQFVFTVCSPWRPADIWCCWQERLDLWSGWSQALAPDSGSGARVCDQPLQRSSLSRQQHLKSAGPHGLQTVNTNCTEEHIKVYIRNSAVHRNMTF